MMQVQSLQHHHEGPYTNKQIHMSSDIELENRYDICELLAAVGPLVASKKQLPDTVWTLLLGLLGVADIKGVRTTDTESKISGILPTYPPIALRMLLETNYAASDGQDLLDADLSGDSASSQSDEMQLPFSENEVHIATLIELELAEDKG